MIVFPLKWLPWILAVCGFIALVTTGDPVSLISLSIGVVWLVLKYKGNKGGSSTKSAAQRPVNNNTVNSTVKATTVNNTVNQTTSNTSNIASSVNTNVCPNCKTPLGEGMSFCIKCGTKVK